MEGLARFPHGATSDNPRCAPDDDVWHYFLEAAMGAAVTEKKIGFHVFHKISQWKPTVKNGESRFSAFQRCIICTCGRCSRWEQRRNVILRFLILYSCSFSLICLVFIFFNIFFVSFKVCNISQRLCSTSYKDHSPEKDSFHPFATESSGDCDGAFSSA